MPWGIGLMMPLVLEIEVEFVGTRFVSGFTPEDCRDRADHLYGAGFWKEIEIKEQREVLCPS